MSTADKLTAGFILLGPWPVIVTGFRVLLAEVRKERNR